MGILITVVVLAVFGLLALLIAAGVRNHRRVMGLMEEQPRWAAAHGFSYHAGPVILTDASIQPPFSASAVNAGHFEGSFNGHRARAFVHTFEGHKDGTFRTVRYAVAAVPHNRPGLFLDIAEKGLPAQLADRLTGGQPLGDPHFDERFAIRTNDVEYARWLLRPDVVAWIKQDQRFATMPVRIDRGWLMTWYEDHLDPKLLPAQLTFLTEILARTR